MRELFRNLIRVFRYVECPLAHSSPIVNRRNPPLRRLKLRFILLANEPFHFQDQGYCRLKLHEEIGNEQVRYTVKLVRDGEIQVVIARVVLHLIFFR